MLRRLSTLVSAVSLVLCVATCVLWAGSYWVAPSVTWTEPRRLRIVGVARGLAYGSEVQQGPGHTGYFGPPHGRNTYVSRSPQPLTTPNLLTTEWRFLGFVVLERSPPLTFRQLVVPCWAFALATAVPPARWYGHRRARLRRARPGLCPACGYDLRATPGRCPECGAVPAKNYISN